MSKSPQKPLLLRNARCWTGSPAEPWAEAVLIEDHRIVFAGNDSDAALPPRTRILDCGGRFVAPGFTDGHVHLMNTGMALGSIDLKGTRSLADALARVRARAAGEPGGQWLQGAGWDQHLWQSGFPTRLDLDSVAPDHPAALVHTSGHCLWVNSLALRTAGITRDTEDPQGGQIERDATGDATGILLDNAMQLVHRAIPARTPDEVRQAILRAQEHALERGVTGAHAMDVGRSELAALEALHHDGELLLRTRAFLRSAYLSEWISRIKTLPFTDMLRVAGVKFFADGALGSLTAWLFDPYSQTEDRGFPLVPPDELERQVATSLTAGLAPAVHAIGDRANREVLDLLERTGHISPELPRRIEHAQLLSPQDIPRFAALNVTASVQPIHATQDMRKVDTHWGERGRFAYAFASLLESGARLAFGSDSPVETIDPLAGMHAAVTRGDASGVPAGGWQPQERVGVEQALLAYTTGCARPVKEERQLGKLAAGYLADLVVLSQDITSLEDPMEILQARVDLTVVDGRVVYERPGAW